MAICKSATRYDSDSYYETIVNEETEDVTVRGTNNGEPVEYSLGSGGGGSDSFVVTVRTDENNNATADKTFEEIEQAWRADSAITLKIVYSYIEHGNTFNEYYLVPATIFTSGSDQYETLDSVYAYALSVRIMDGQIYNISCVSAQINPVGVTTNRGHKNFE